MAEGHGIAARGNPGYAILRHLVAVWAMDDLVHAASGFAPDLSRVGLAGHFQRLGLDDWAAITNVTPARVGSPANFEVPFMLDSSHQVDGVDVRNYFGLSTVVIGYAHRSYFEVEDAAAAQLP